MSRAYGIPVYPWSGNGRAPGMTSRLFGDIDVHELAWQDDALCQYTDPELFHPDKGQPSAPAKQICMACDVRTACLEYALGRREAWGVWGGKSERERKAILRERREGRVAA